MGVTQERGHHDQKADHDNRAGSPGTAAARPGRRKALRHVVDYALREEQLHRQEGRQPKRNFNRNVRALIDALRRPPDEDSISLIWHVDDVLSVRPDLTKAQAREVLQAVPDRHDANYGVTWDTLEIVANDLFPRGGEPS